MRPSWLIHSLSLRGQKNERRDTWLSPLLSLSQETGRGGEMNTILAIFVIIVFAAFWTWVFWGFLSVIYHTIMLAFYAVGWTVISVFEIVTRVSKAIHRMVSR